MAIQSMRRALFRTQRTQRGLTLVEVMVSMALLGIALVGVAQMQLVASDGNARGRNMARASQIASHLSEAMQLWAYNDPRLAANQTFVGSTATPRPVTSAGDLSGASAMGYALGDYGDGAATNPNQRAVLIGGRADSNLPPASIDQKYRVYWWVGAEDQNSDGIAEAKVVSIAVRWREASRWRNVNFTLAKFNLDALRP